MVPRPSTRARQPGATAATARRRWGKSRSAHPCRRARGAHPHVRTLHRDAPGCADLVSRRERRSGPPRGSDQGTRVSRRRFSGLRYTDLGGLLPFVRGRLVVWRAHGPSTLRPERPLSHRVICVVPHAFGLLAHLVDTLDQSPDLIPGRRVSFSHSVPRKSKSHAAWPSSAGRNAGNIDGRETRADV